MNRESLARSVALPLVLVVAVSGCSDQSLPRPLGPGGAVTSVATQEANVQTLTRSIAGALGEPALRRALMEDLRDSPFPEHKIHLKSYLLGSRGRPLLDAAAARSGLPNEELRALLDRVPDLELVVPRPLDRVRWTGSDTVVVFGTDRDPDEVLKVEGSLGGYTPGGAAVHVGREEVPQYVVLMVRPVRSDFPADPEAVRAATPKRNRVTVALREIEFSLDPARRDPDCTAAACSRGRGGRGPGGGNDDGVTIMEFCAPGQSPPGCTLPPDYDEPTDPVVPNPTVGESYAHCTTPSGDDSDNDGVRDGCEERLARAFEPALRIMYSDRCPEREPYWTVAKWNGRPNALKVMYLLSYYRDCGSSASHAGDSEWIIVTAETSSPTSSIWNTYSVTTSAHYGAITDGTRTTVYTGWPQWHRGEYRKRPIVWVALDKHANYKSLSDCDAGAWGYDTCSYSSAEVGVGILSHAEANIGNVWVYGGVLQLKNLVYSRRGISGYPEYMWGYDASGSGANFCGWQTQRTDCAGKWNAPLFNYSF